TYGAKSRESDPDCEAHEGPAARACPTLLSLHRFEGLPFSAQLSGNRSPGGHHLATYTWHHRRPLAGLAGSPRCGTRIPKSRAMPSLLLTRPYALFSSQSSRLTI